MTKGELIYLLTKSPVPDDAIVVLSRDGEGNGYSPCSDWTACRYRAETTWQGEIDHPDEPFSEGASVPAIVLWPVN